MFIIINYIFILGTFKAGASLPGVGVVVHDEWGMYWYPDIRANPEKYKYNQVLGIGM